jgi:hypothetical protein
MHCESYMVFKDSIWVICQGAAIKLSPKKHMAMQKSGGEALGIKMADKSTKAGTQQKVPIELKINLEVSDSSASYYSNYFEIAHTSNDFTIYGGRIPAKLTPQRLNTAKESGRLTIEADVEITFPATIMISLLRVLNTQKESFERNNSIKLVINNMIAGHVGKYEYNKYFTAKRNDDRYETK